MTAVVAGGGGGGGSGSGGGVCDVLFLVLVTVAIITLYSQFIYHKEIAVLQRHRAVPRSP